MLEIKVAVRPKKIASLSVELVIGQLLAEPFPNLTRAEVELSTSLGVFT
jgi:hypothetical protein